MYDPWLQPDGTIDVNYIHSNGPKGDNWGRMSLLQRLIAFAVIVDEGLVDSIIEQTDFDILNFGEESVRPLVLSCLKCRP